MWKYFLVFLIVFLLIMSGGYFLYFRNLPNKTPVEPDLPITTVQTPQPTLTSIEPEFSINKASLYLLINAHRKENQLANLISNSQLEASAELKLSDMIANKYYRHQDVQGDPGWHFVKQAGYQYLLIGENLAFQLNSEWQILDSWINSPAHNQQLLDPKYEDFGLAVDCTALEKYANSGCITVLHLGLD